MTGGSPGDTAERYRRVARAFTQRVEAVPAGGWARPSPCQGWLASDVVRHLAEWVPAFFADGGGPPLPATPPSHADPAGAWRALDAAIQASLDDPNQAASEIDHSRVGRRRFDEAIDQFVLPDVFIHTWDLARATGQDDTIDPDAVALLLTWTEANVDLLAGSGMFAAPIQAGPGEPDQVRLLRLLGRQA